MRPLLATAILLAALAPKAVRAESLSADELARLARRETVVREHTLERGDKRWIGGVTYTVMDATAAEISAVLEDVAALRRVLPKTKRATVIGASHDGDTKLELVQGNAVMEAEYTVIVRRTPGESRFWLDPSRPHDIDDAWGFFRYESFSSQRGEPRVLLTYGILVDVGPGIVRQLFEDRVRAALLSVPQRVQRSVAEARRPE